MAKIGVVPASMVQREGRMDAEHFLGQDYAIEHQHRAVRRKTQELDTAKRKLAGMRPGPLPGVTAIDMGVCGVNLGTIVTEGVVQCECGARFNEADLEGGFIPPHKRPTGDEPEVPSEPEEGDYTTSDHRHFYQYGKRVLTAPAGAEWDVVVMLLMEHMEAQSFFPNVWFISDHGNPHLIDINQEAAK